MMGALQDEVPMRLALVEAMGEPQLTDEDGGFVVPALEDERVQVFVVARGFEPWISERLALGHDLEVTLEDPARLRLAVVDGEGHPVEGARVAAWRDATGPDSRSPWGRRGIGRYGSRALDVVPLDADGAPRPPAESDDGEGEPASDETSGDDASEDDGVVGGASGLFDVLGLGPAGNRVVVRAEGFASTVLAVEGVEPGRRLDERVVLTAGASLAGVVLDDDDAPVPDAELSASREDEDDGPRGADRVTGRSDAEGRFTLAGLPAGRWTLAVEAAGLSAPEPEPFELAQGEARTDLELRMVTSGRLVGYVLDADGNPVDQRQVVARVDDDRPRVRWQGTQTTSDGRFELLDVEPGPWLVQSVPAQEAHVVVPSGGEVEVLLRLPRLPVLTGRVTLADGTPVPGAHVAALQPAGGEDGRVAVLGRIDSGDDGRYRLELRQVGQVSLQAAHPESGLTEVGSALVDWGSALDLDLVFPDTVLAGRVTAEDDGAPIPDAFVVLMSDVRRMQQVRTDGEGAFSFPRMPAGAWSLRVRASGWQPATVEVETGPAGGGDPVEVQLERAAALEGRVDEADGSPAEDGLTVAVGTSGAERFDVESRVSTKQGRYRFDTLAPGAWEVRVFASRSDLYSGDAEPLAISSVRLVAGETGTLDLVVTP
jgi:uncharacterized GH25 family protein